MSVYRVCEFGRICPASCTEGVWATMVPPGKEITIKNQDILMRIIPLFESVIES